MAKKLKGLDEALIDMGIETPELPKGIDLISMDFGRTDLNLLAEKINEVIRKIN